MTRKTTAHLFCSVNGVVESPDQFQFDSFGPEEGEAMGRSLTGVTDVVIGRKLWQEWSAYWSDRGDDDFGAFINPVRKHAIGSLPADPGWNTTVVTGDPVTHVADLRASGEGKIVVVGGIETIRSLFVAGQIDELALTMHPAVTPQGRRLFDETVPLTRLQLVDSQITSAGNAHLTYALK